jgi:phasin family protein
MAAKKTTAKTVAGPETTNVMTTDHTAGAASTTAPGETRAAEAAAANPGVTAKAAAQPKPEVDQAEPKEKEMLIMDKAIKTTEELMAFGQGNVEALLKSSQIWAAGVQDLGKHVAATAQATMDETMATVKAISSVKSLKEAMDLQASFAKTAMEKMLAETGKITDASMKLAEQAIAPITERVTIATEKFARPV